MNDADEDMLIAYGAGILTAFVAIPMIALIAVRESTTVQRWVRQFVVKQVDDALADARRSIPAAYRPAEALLTRTVQTATGKSLEVLFHEEVSERVGVLALDQLGVR